MGKLNIDLAELLNKELIDMENGDCYIGEYKNLKKMKKEVGKIMEYILEKNFISVEIINKELMEKLVNTLLNKKMNEIDMEIFLLTILEQVLFLILKNIKTNMKSVDLKTFPLPYSMITSKINYDLKDCLTVSFIRKG